MNLIESSDFSIADLLESRPINFFIFSMPGDTKLSAGAAMHICEGVAEGYIVSDFYGRKLTIPAKLSLSEIEALSPTPFQYGDVPFDSTSADEHIHNVEEAIKELATFPERGKVVISSVIRTKREKRLSEVLSSLSAACPNAYIYSFRTSETGLWVGASPELLWSQKGCEGKTMSLAGTRKRGTDSEWDEKNIEEQKLVTDFICREIERAGLQPTAGRTHTRAAGPVEHLCTEIRTAGVSSGGVMKLASNLSPTPALSGYPRENALDTIAKLEKHSRDCYGGFSGLHTPLFTNLYVTLRCCRLFESEALLYAGGGITPLSQPEAEWIETRMKASTLIEFL